jgi:hypothetical protein
MFNQEWKEHYFERNNFTNSEKEEIMNAFKEAELIEKYYNKDLCKFNMDQIPKLIQVTKNKYTQIYCDYCNWCLSEAYIEYFNPYDIYTEDDEELI